MESQSLEEGNPTDRAIFTLLMLLALIVLFQRRFNWGQFFTRNKAVSILLLYALISFVWSDFPLVALKRWFRDLGNYFVILVAVSERDPVEGLRAVLRRFSYLIISLSVLLIKYYPGLGKVFSPWSGEAMFVGATTGKNLLGAVCLISGLYFFWDTIARWSQRKEKQTRKILLVNGAFLWMTIWLINLASSTTADVCLALGCFVIAITHIGRIQRHPRFLKVLIPLIFAAYLVLAFGFNMSGQMADAVGKDPTLTDRTKIWSIVLSMGTNPIFGTGYESFWLGPRLEYFWSRGLGAINEAHNGFIEVYLNLGLIGDALIVLFIFGCYHTMASRLKPFQKLGSISLAIWITVMFYSMTEVAFRSGPMLMVFLLAGLSAPQSRSLDEESDVPEELGLVTASATQHTLGGESEL